MGIANILLVNLCVNLFCFMFFFLFIFDTRFLIDRKNIMQIVPDGHGFEEPLLHNLYG